MPSKPEPVPVKRGVTIPVPQPAPKPYKPKGYQRERITKALGRASDSQVHLSWRYVVSSPVSQPPAALEYSQRPGSEPPRTCGIRPRPLVS